MTYEIDIFTLAEAREGDGPIISASEWRQETRLDEAGSFSLIMPAMDPRGSFVSLKDRLRCYGRIGTVRTLLGVGIVDQRELSVDSESLNVTGPDILHELAGRYTAGETICNTEWTYITYGGAAHGAVRHLHDSDDVDMPLAYDGNTGTHDSEALDISYVGSGSTQHWVYVGFDQKFSGCHFYFETLNTAGSATLEGQIFDGVNWVGVTLTDGTIAGGRTWGVNGQVTFVTPASWVRNEPTVTSGDWFWIRFRALNPGTTSTDIEIAEVKIYGDVPTTDGINQIMAYAPTTWVQSGYGATGAEAIFSSAKMSVLEALKALAEKTTEHFTYAWNSGVGKWEITWVTAWTASNHIAVWGGEPADIGAATAIVPIIDLSESRDSTEVYSRIYPTGIGRGAGEATLATSSYATDKWAGYTIDKSNNYILRTAAETTFGRIERHEEFSDVVFDDADQDTVAAADMLATSAYNWLKEHSSEEKFYTFRVSGYHATLAVGYKTDAVVERYRTATKVININTLVAATPLNIMATTLTWDQDGNVVTDMNATTLSSRFVEDDARVIAKTIQEFRRLKKGWGLSAAAQGGSAGHTRMHNLLNADDHGDTLTKSPTAGHVIVGDGTDWTTLAVGTAGQVLAVSAGVPAWTNSTGGRIFVFFYADALVVGDLGLRLYVDAGYTVNTIHASVGTAPTGSVITVVVYDNGGSGMSTNIADGAYAGTSSPVQAVTSGHYFTCAVTAIGSTTPGTGLVVQVRCG
uniref:Uncharacterized protein n=1 Tax=viral metagenome TaxID=1070528 RepID=A0A6M3KQR1_9ZZZZ